MRRRADKFNKASLNVSGGAGVNVVTNGVTEKNSKSKCSSGKTRNSKVSIPGSMNKNLIRYNGGSGVTTNIDLDINKSK